MARKNVTVGEYRDLYDRVGYWLTSYTGARVEERKGEAERVREAVRELAEVECKRATARDRETATRMLERATKIVEAEFGK